MNAKTALSVAATALVLLLAACGNKGPLVMPQKPVPVEVPSAEPAAPAGDLPSPPAADTPATDETADPQDPAYISDDGDG